MEAVEDQRMLLSPAGADHVSLIHGGKINSSINTPASKSLEPTTAMIIDTKADTNIPEGLRDELICHVLSFLPTKDAVRTSILSKRWRYLWTNITNFLFCDPLAAPLDTERDYNFVDRVFHHCSSDPIQRLCLNTRRAEFYRVKAWIDEAIRRNVCELELRLVKFPSCVFTCKTLRVLKLHARNESKYEIPTSFYLPSLKILYILLFNPLNNLTEKLFSSCPALEDLHVLVFGVKKDSCFVISAPVLKRLKLELYIEPSNCKFIINAPNLKYMDIFDGQMSDYEVQKVSPVAQAKLRFQVIFCGPVNDNHETIINNRALELLKGLIGVKSMSLLGASTMKVLGRAFQHDHHLMFSNMTRLELINFEPHGRKILLRLLQVCPKLEVLILKKTYKILGTVAVASDWSEPQISPVCLSLCLELVEIEGFEGNGFELKLVEYLLVHAAVIKKLTINAKGMAPETKVELSKRLSEFPRSSTTCQVHIMG